MSIKTKDWTAQIDRMPGAASFRTYGTVIVAIRALHQRLERRRTNPMICAWIATETSNQSSLQVQTDKFVEYKAMGNQCHGVSIFHDGKLIHHIDEVLITH